MTGEQSAPNQRVETDRTVDFESPRWRESDGRQDAAPGKTPQVPRARPRGRVPDQDSI